MKVENYIYFITQAEPKKNISFGHFFRCLEIAKFQKKRGFKCLFVLENSYYVKNLLRINKFKSIELSGLIKNKRIIKDSIIIFDKFSYNKKQFQYFKFAKKTIIFDDFNKYKNSKYYLRLTSNLGYTKYSNKHINSANFRLPKFLNKKINSRKIKKKDYLIFLGGSDIKGNIKKIIKFIISEKINKKNKFNIYLGPGVKNKYKKYKNIYFHKESEVKLKMLINKHKNVITNGGNTMFEMVTEKKKCIVFPSNSREKINAKYLFKKNIINIYNNKISFRDNLSNLNNISETILANNNLKLKSKYIKLDFKRLFK